LYGLLDGRHPHHVLDLLGIPIWLAAIPPLVALISVALWWARPRIRRNEGYRLAFIASVSLTALEAILAVLFLFVLVLFSQSGGLENF
jgi:hypothetical protein